MKWPQQKDEIKASFQRDGFVIVRNFLDEAALNTVRTNLQRYVDETVPNLPDMDAFCEDPEERRQIRMLSRMEKHDAFFAQMLKEGAVAELARDLSSTKLKPHDAAFFNKLPKIGDQTPPHQDGFYFLLKPCEALTIWLALDTVDRENGCIYYVRGSHQRGMRPHSRTRVLGFSQGIIDYGTAEDVEAEEAACLAPGDVIVHHALTIHRADPNRSSRLRRALGFVYFSADSVVDEAASEQYQQQLNDEWHAEGKI